MPETSCFATDYQQARQAFFHACQHLNLKPKSYAHPHTGPNGESLTTDVVWLGNSQAQTVLVMLSATHGVEGFCGSAAQVDFLIHYKTLPPDVAVLLVHAVNPYGFAWLRRVDEAGVDLNRNYVDFSQPLPRNDGYSALADVIVPPTLHQQALKQCDATLAHYQQIHGDEAYEKALSSGQYTHANGLFYGGQQPCWSRITCETIMAEFQLTARKRVAVIDFHTGLGPWAYGEPICDHIPSSLGAKLARLWYGSAVTEPALGTSSSVAKYGLSDFGWMHVLGDKLVFIALEFGTDSFENMKQVLRADHWLHAQCQVNWADEQTQMIKADIRQHFYPTSMAWQEKVLRRSRECIAQAITGLTAEM